MNVTYCVMLGVCLDGPELRGIYSWDDDPDEAMREAYLWKQGACFRMLWYKYGAKGIGL